MINLSFADFRTDLLLRYSAERRRGARARGFIFSPEEVDAILALWGDVIEGEPAHSIEALRLSMRGGGLVEITPAFIHFEEPQPGEGRADPFEEAHAATLHVMRFWGGNAALPLDDRAEAREGRLIMRAFAEVYGARLDDSSEAFTPLALTDEETARLPALRQQIRARFKDAPPAAPNEKRQLAALYAARYPFRSPAAA